MKSQMYAAIDMASDDHRANRHIVEAVAGSLPFAATVNEKAGRGPLCILVSIALGLSSFKSRPNPAPVAVARKNIGYRPSFH